MATSPVSISLRQEIEKFSEEKAAALTIGGTFFTVKFVTSIIIFGYFPSWYTFLFIVLTGFLWFIPLVYLAGHYLQVTFRLRRVRRRRQSLIEQEWKLD